MPKITKQLIDRADAPETGDISIWDTDLPGFGVRIQASGRKTYAVRYRTKDEKRIQRKVTICRCCDTTPEKARAMARDIFQSVAAGQDPAAERKPVAHIQALTIEDMFKARVEYMRSQDKTNTMHVERQLLLAKNNAADSIGRGKAPADVTPDDIIEYLATFYEAGHRGAADKSRSYLHAAFNWAMLSANDYTVKGRKNWGIKHNPVASVAKDKGAATTRDRNLSAEEIRQLWIASSDGNAGFTDGTQACIKLLVACGQRVQETLRAEGCEIDLQAKEWTIPARKTKGRTHTHVVPLPSIIIPVLQALIEKHGDGPLFPARHTTSASGLLGSLAINQAVRRFVESEKTSMPAFQPRDIRRTWKSRAHDAGVDRFTRDLIQQHAKGDTGSKHYDRAEYMPQMRTAMDKWGRWLADVVDGEKPGAAVPPLKLVA